jgi:hypothetical protein
LCDDSVSSVQLPYCISMDSLRQLAWHLTQVAIAILPCLRVEDEISMTSSAPGISELLAIADSPSASTLNNSKVEEPHTTLVLGSFMGDPLSCISSHVGDTMQHTNEFDSKD